PHRCIRRQLARGVAARPNRQGSGIRDAAVGDGRNRDAYARGNRVAAEPRADVGGDATDYAGSAATIASRSGLNRPGAAAITSLVRRNSVPPAKSPTRPPASLTRSAPAATSHARKLVTQKPSSRPD